MKLFLHIGPHKTGSTSIQNSLQRGREALLRQGVLYYYSAPLPIMGLVLRFAPDTLLEAPHVRAHFPRAEDARAWSRGCWQDLASKVAENDAETCVVSSEHFAFFPPEAAQQTVTALREIFDDITLVCYARSPDGLYPSGLQQRIAAGARLSELPPPGGRKYRLREQIDAFANQMEPGKVRIRAFDRANLLGGDVVRDFLSLLGTADRPVEIPSVSANESLPGAAVAWLLTVNETWDRARLTPERERVMGILRSSPALAGLPKLKLSDAALNAAILAGASEDIAWINDRYLQGQTPLPMAPEGTDTGILKDWTRDRIRDWIMSYLTPGAMELIAREIMASGPGRARSSPKGSGKGKASGPQSTADRQGERKVKKA